MQPRFSVSWTGSVARMAASSSCAWVIPSELLRSLIAPKVCRTFKCFFLRGLGARPRVLVGDGPPHRQRGVSTAHQPIGAGPMAGLAQPHPAPPQPSDHHGGPRRPWRARRVPLAAPQWLCQIPRAKQRPGPVERPRGTARSTADGVLAGPERSCTPGHRISSPRAGQDIQSPPHNKALEGIWPEFQHSCASWAGSFNKSWLILGPAKKCCVWGIRQRMTEACDVHYCRKIKQHI